jgi:hypothetical protein
MPYDNPTIAEFKTYFTRDFPYGSDPATSILDADIGKAFGEANLLMNPNLWNSQEAWTIGYMYCAAHFLVIDLQMSSQGISGVGNWLTTSKSVGSISESFQIPQRILDNPELAAFSKTNYGMKFLQLILPQLVGQIFSVYGGTRA